MSISERKKRAWEERDRLILETADRLLLDHGYLGLNLDQLAKKIEYSKATIYNHYESKEDLMMAVAVMHQEIRVNYFSRALTFDGNSRDRIFVVGIANSLLADRYPHGFSLAQLISMPSIWEKASGERQNAYLQVSGQSLKIMLEIIRQARQAGDLDANFPRDEHVLTGLIALAKGSALLAGDFQMLPDELAIRPLDLLFDNYGMYLNGVGWKPLDQECDNNETHARILEMFGESHSG